MSKNIRTGVSTRAIQKIQAQLTLGMYQMENYRKELSKPVADTVTYYLVKKTLEIVNFRTWFQMNRPEYIVSGSLRGCQGHKERLLEAS
jgi:hypothetical protein